MARRKNPEKKKALSEGEMRRLEECNYEARLAKKDAEIARKNYEIQQLRLELFKIKVEDVRKTAEEKADIVRAKQKSYLEFTEALKNNYKLEDKWGYDPISGEIQE